MRQTLKAKLQQLWYPSAFRLQKQDFTKEQLDVLEELISLIQPSFSQELESYEDERVRMARFLVDLGTGIWRVRRKTHAMKRIPKELRDAMFSLESTWDSMSEGGVEIVDHIGTLPPEDEVKIVEVRQIRGFEGSKVIDAIRPTISLRGQIVQLGEVIVGVPEDEPCQEGQTAQSAGAGSVA